MKLSFITATYNGLGYTREMLRSFHATVPSKTDDFEYIIVDDCSDDGTRGFLKTLAPPFRVILSEENSGFAVANNKGAHAATGDYLIFLNNDLLLTPGWLEPMLAAFQRFPKTGAVGNIQINPKTRLIDHAGVFFDLQGRPSHARKNRKRCPQCPYTEWNAITAACMIVPRSIFLDQDGFDESYINGCEDIDFCLKLRVAGYRLMVANQSIIGHHVSTSPGRHSFNDRNSRLFLQRWQTKTIPWGQTEWAPEYLHRYAREFWKFNLRKLAKALFMIANKGRLTHRYHPPQKPL